MHSELLLKGLSLRYIANALQCILNSFLRDRLWDTFRNILTMQLPGGSQAPTSPPGPPPPPWLRFWNEWVINERCLFKTLLWYTANSISFRNKILTCCPSLPFSLAFHCPAPLPLPLPPPPPPPLPPPPLLQQLPFYNAIQLIRKWDTVFFNAFWTP